MIRACSNVICHPILNLCFILPSKLREHEGLALGLPVKQRSAALCGFSSNRVRAGQVRVCPTAARGALSKAPRSQAA